MSVIDSMALSAASSVYGEQILIVLDFNIRITKDGVMLPQERGLAH
jgi:hypothetical protein